MAASRSLVAPTANPLLEQALQQKLERRAERSGSLGELEPLAVRLGLMQNTLKPRFRDPRLLVFAADHGLAVDGLMPPGGSLTHELVQQLLARRLPLGVFARIQQLELTVIDCGMSESLPAHDGLLMRKIAHGTRNARVASAMSLDQAHAAMRAGMEIGDKLGGNAFVLAGVGVGSHESAALVLARLTAAPVRDFVLSGPEMDPDLLAHLLNLTGAAQARHREVADPVEVLAAFGGFEVAVMVGVMLMAASRRDLLIVDGLPACTALLIASRIAPAVTDYVLFTRSHRHHGLDRAMALFQASALVEIGMDSTDGTGGALAWPLVRSAAALLTEVADGEDAGPSHPGALGG